MSPTRLFRTVAIAEAVTWTGLLIGLFLKYGPAENETAVRVFGMAHGVVFVAYVVISGVLWVDRQWSVGRLALVLAAAVPPLTTIPLEAWAIRKGWLGDAWRLPAGAGQGRLDRLVGWLIGNPLRGVAVGAVAVAALTGLALLVGPPTS